MELRQFAQHCDSRPYLEALLLTYHQAEALMLLNDMRQDQKRSGSSGGLSPAKIAFRITTHWRT